MSSQASSHARFRAVLLDDNARDRNDFLRLLKRHPSIQLVGQTDNLKTALELIEREGADVLFLEAKIGGQDLFSECEQVPPIVRLIFVTRQREGAWRAFEVDALDYLIKPLEPRRFSETIRRMLRIEWQRPEIAPPPVDRALIPFERGRRGVSLEDICMVQAFGNYTRVSLAQGGSEIVLRSLAKWQGLLPMPPFLRAHRNTIVNSRHVRSLDESSDGWILRLDNVEESVAVSRRCLTDVRHVLFSSAGAVAH